MPQKVSASMITSVPFFCNEFFKVLNIKLNFPFQIPSRPHCSKLKQILQCLYKGNDHDSLRKMFTSPINASPALMMAS